MPYLRGKNISPPPCQDVQDKWTCSKIQIIFPVLYLIPPHPANDAAAAADGYNSRCQASTVHFILPDSARVRHLNAFYA